MGGATLMAGEAALRVGAGLVSVITRAAHRPAILSRRPELMVVDADDEQGRRELLARASTLIVGPGLGRAAWGHGLLKEAIEASKPMVLDATACMASPRFGSNRVHPSSSPPTPARRRCCSRPPPMTYKRIA